MEVQLIRVEVNLKQKDMFGCFLFYMAKEEREKKRYEQKIFFYYLIHTDSEGKMKEGNSWFTAGDAAKKAFVFSKRKKVENRNLYSGDYIHFEGREYDEMDRLNSLFLFKLYKIEKNIKSNSML